MSNDIELVFRFQVAGKAALDQIAASAKSLTGEMRVGNQVVGQMTAGMTVASAKAKTLSTDMASLAKSSNEASTGMLGAVVKGGLLVSVMESLAAKTKEYSIGAAQMAARTQTLGVVMDNLAKQNNLSVESTRAQADATRKLGITRQESLSVISKLVAAQIDLKRSTELARMAQDAAVISGQNSSDALAGIVHGITTRQPEILRTYGIVVDFEREYIRVARERGVALTAQEKQEVALQAVLAQSGKIAGSYEAAMLTTGKQMTSLTRYVDDAKNAIGEGLIPVLGKAVFAMTDLAKWTEQNADKFSTMATMAGGAGLAIAALSLASNVTPIGRGAKVAAAVGGAAAGYFFAPTMRDNVEEGGQRSVDAILKRREEINQKLQRSDLGAAEAKSLRQQFNDTYLALETVKRTAADLLGRELIKAGPEGPTLGDWARKSKDFEMDLGGGLRISAGDVSAAAARLYSPDTTGATFNQKGFDEAQARERAAQAKEQFGKASKEVRDYLEGIREQAMDPYFKLISDEEQEIRKLLEKYPLGTSQKLISDVRDSFDSRRRILRDQALSEIPRYGRDSFGRPNSDPLLSGSIPNMAGLLANNPNTDSYGQFFSSGASRVAAQVEINNPQLTGEKLLADMRGRSLESMQRYTGYQEQMMRMLLGPAGELTAIDRIAALREDAAKRVLETSKKDYEARLVYEDRLNQISMDRELQLATMRQKREQQNQETAGRVFDALLTRGTTGTSDLVKGSLLGQGRQLFMNASSGVVGGAGRFLGGLIPGQQDADGNPTAIGRLFAGTVFDKQNTELGKNTSEMTKLRGSILTLNRTIGSVSVGGASTAGGGGLDALLPGSGLNLLDGITGANMGGLIGKSAGTSWITGKANALRAPLSQFGAGAGSLLRAGLFSGFRDDDFSMVGPDGRMNTRSGLKLDSTAARVGNVAGSTAAITAGALTAFNGFKEGGFSGNSRGIAATLGTAALIPGPQQPFIAAAAASAALVSMLVPDPKKKRAAQMQAELEAARREDPVGRSYEFDRSGRSVSYDYTGQMRNISVTNQFQISALDGPSVEQVLHSSRAAIADSLSSAISDGLSGRLMSNLRTAQGG